ncbi:MAG: hypothetical protein ACUVRL_07650 [Candidatus Saccharicenans sp.]|uniref:hypothetical protein n=1 Tax=Candidatus Saccharicenans sp. TaxID=2819258 RepID=UPI00404B32F0
MQRRLQCLLVDLGWRLVPATGFRCWLLQKHLDHCPACQDSLVGLEEARSLILRVRASWPNGIVARAEETIGREEMAPGFSSSGGGPGWLVRAYAGLAAVVIVILMAWFGWYLARKEAGLSARPGYDTNETKIVSQVSLDYVRAKGQPASTYIYRTDDPEMVIIWVEAVN